MWGVGARRRVAAQIDSIRDWKVACAPYTDAPDGARALTFVDPPYIDKGTRYVHGARGLDFDALAAWCRERRGALVVCEQEGAEWLPFVPLATAKSTRGTTAEAVWIAGSAVT